MKFFNKAKRKDTRNLTPSKQPKFLLDGDKSDKDFFLEKKEEEMNDEELENQVYSK